MVYGFDDAPKLGKAPHLLFVTDHHRSLSSEAFLLAQKLRRGIPACCPSYTKNHGFRLFVDIIATAGSAAYATITVVTSARGWPATTCTAQPPARGRQQQRDTADERKRALTDPPAPLPPQTCGVEKFSTGKIWDAIALLQDGPKRYK